MILPLISRIVSRARHSEGRTRRAALGAATGIVGRLSATVIGLATTPIIVKGLGNEGFGLAIAIGGVIQWLSLANFGLAQGLQNSLIAAAAQDDKPRQHQLISTTLALLVTFMSVLLAAWVVAGFYVPWSRVFPTANPRFQADVVPALNVAFVGFNYQLLLGAILSILAARQDVHYGVILTSLASTAGSIGGAVAVFRGGGLFAYTLSNVACMLAVSFVMVTWYFLRPSNRFLIPSLSGFRAGFVKRLAASSSWFFVIQICWLALFQVDAFVIMHCARTEDITPYNIAMRIFGLVSVLYSFLAQPLWAAYGNAASSGELPWVRRTHNKIRLYFLATYSVVLVAIVSLGPWLIPYWVGKAATPSLALLVAAGLYVGLKNWAEIHAVVTNAMDRIRSQAISAVAQCAVYIPLVILMTTQFSAVGTAAAGAISFALVSAWALPLIVRRSLAESA